jgi:hypothetical protein
MTSFRSLLVPVVLFVALAAAHAVQADVSINPGESIFVNSPQTVSCSYSLTPPPAPPAVLRVCDCEQGVNWPSAGQAIAADGDGLINQCKSINSNSSPFNCKPLTVSPGSVITCSCEQGVNWPSCGQAIGTDGADLIKQCKTLNSNSAPFACTVN